MRLKIISIPNINVCVIHCYAELDIVNVWLKLLEKIVERETGINVCLRSTVICPTDLPKTDSEIDANYRWGAAESALLGDAYLRDPNTVVITSGPVPIWMSQSGYLNFVDGKEDRPNIQVMADRVNQQNFFEIAQPMLIEYVKRHFGS
jgi:hypothetical protein